LGSEVTAEVEKPVKLVKRDRSGEVNYGELKTPTVIRKRVAGEPAQPAPNTGDLDYLDIPAFLRRQAD
jgi:cell division protein FtsZ